jgi:hypothetical protein
MEKKKCVDLSPRYILEASVFLPVTKQKVLGKYPERETLPKEPGSLNSRPGA